MLLKKWLAKPVTQEMLDEAIITSKEVFFDNPNVFNYKSWQLLIVRHKGKLPLRIKAVAEGTKIPTGNVMLTIEATDPDFFWLVNAMETVIMNTWYPITVCTRSHLITNILKEYFIKTSDSPDMYQVYLHDFAQRSVTCMEQAGIGGMAHLVNGKGSDTMMAIPYAKKYYNAEHKNLLFSVKATEHSIQTALGEDNEFEITKEIMKNHPNGILSVVSDSYNIENAVNVYCNELKPFIMARNGKFVVRPDSPRFAGDTPENQILWIVETLWNSFGGTINKKGYKVLDSHCGVIYGDSLTEEQIKAGLEKLENNGFSSDNCVYGCGSYLLQKLNRDTQRFAIKCSAQKRNNEWFDVQKKPLDKTKSSKAGKLALIYENGQYYTIREEELNNRKNLLEVVYENGELIKEYTFDEVRKNAEL